MTPRHSPAILIGMTTVAETSETSYQVNGLRLEGDCSKDYHFHKLYVRGGRRLTTYLAEELNIDQGHLSHILSPHHPRLGSPSLIAQLSRLLEVHPSEMVKFLKLLGKDISPLEGVWDAPKGRCPG